MNNMLFSVKFVLMDPVDRQIAEVRKLTEENNEMLHKMKRTMRITAIFRTIYWVIVIGLAVGAYYVVQPYVEQAQSVYSNIDERFTAVDEEFQGNLDSFLNLFRSDKTETVAE